MSNLYAAHVAFDGLQDTDRCKYLMRMLCADKMGLTDGNWDSLLYHLILLADEGQAERLFGVWPLECAAAMEAMHNTEEAVALINKTAQAGALAGIMGALGGLGE